jgi:hypothetical protein
MIVRVDFISVTVLGPQTRAKQAFKPAEWPGWTCTVKGQAVLFEGEGRTIEVPRSSCVITREAPP